MDKYNCNRCIFGRHCDETNPAPYPKWAIEGVIESRTCLLPMVTPFSWFMLKLYSHHQNGLLPLSGGLMEQPNIYLDAMQILESTLNRIKREWPKPKS